MTLPSTTANTVRVIAEVEDARSRLGTFWFSMARIFLLATLLAAPLAFGAVQTWAWTSLVFLALFLLVLWAVGSLRRGVLRIAWSPLYLPAALFLLLVMLQFYGRLTLDPFATRESLLKLGTDLILFFLARQLLWEGRKGPWQNFGLTIAIYAFSLSLFAIFQFFSSGGLIYWVVRTTGWTFGPYVNHNHYAGLMEMLIPIALAFVLSRQEGYPARVMLWFAVAVPIASVLLSGSRGGLVSLLAEIAILGAILVRHAPRRGGRSSVKLWGLGIAAAVLLFFWMDPGNISKHLDRKSVV